MGSHSQQHLCVDLNLHRPRAVFRWVHSSTIGYKLQHFLVTATWIWHIAQWEDLPQKNPKRPERKQTMRGWISYRERKKAGQTKDNQVINYQHHLRWSCKGWEQRTKNEIETRQGRERERGKKILPGIKSVEGRREVKYRRGEESGQVGTAGVWVWNIGGEITQRASRRRLERSVTGTHHVSVLDVKMPSMKASGGIHFTGSMARPPFL